MNDDARFSSIFQASVSFIFTLIASHWAWFFDDSRCWLSTAAALAAAKMQAPNKGFVRDYDNNIPEELLSLSNISSLSIKPKIQEYTWFFQFSFDPLKRATDEIPRAHCICIPSTAGLLTVCLTPAWMKLLTIDFIYETYRTGQRLPKTGLLVVSLRFMAFYW